METGDETMRIRNYFPEMAKSDGEVIAQFGQAKLIKTVEGKYQLRGGSKEDLISAREWISLFLNDAVVREC